jgi:hypothetical protein
MDMLHLFLLFSGFVIGLGAVTVIDLHGFLGRHSPYWTEATTRTHKVTKPLIWAGILLVAVGFSGLFAGGWFIKTAFWCIGAIILLILNGSYLSFVISPTLLKRESEGRARELLPVSLQAKITVSFLISVLCWWGLFVLVLWEIGIRSGLV